jgi:uncharacterized protein
VLVVDTNILVYAADADSPFHSACLAWVEAQRPRPDAWFTTWPIVYEFLRVTTHPRVMRQPWRAADAWQFVAAVLASPGMEVLAATPRHAAVAAQVIDELPHLSGNLLHDVHTAVLMREHGIRRIVTRDTDFHRFPFLESFDPVA